MHRVQRIPENEKRGRVHTSTVSVVIIDDKINHQVDINEKDLEYRWHSGTGAGGQHRNKTQNCLELKHRPTGLCVNANGRSRKDNEQRARATLERLVSDRLVSEAQDKIDLKRKEQAGDRSRSGERIRTWKYQTGRVMDHRSSKTYRIPDVEKKGIKILW